MTINIEQLRQDLRLTAEREGWSAEETLEVGAAIKAAIDAGDEEALQSWAVILGEWRELLASYTPRLRAFEVCVRAEARKAA